MKHTSHKSWIVLVVVSFLALAGFGQASAVLAQDVPKAFNSPEDAVTSLIDAVKEKDVSALLTILGPATQEWIISGDKVQDDDARIRFLASYDEKNMLETDGETKAILVVGADGYPFPIPIVKINAGWAFDPDQGKEEILDRRIGENELTTIQVLLAIADAQQDYASADRNGDGLLEYAAKFKSSDGNKDGLYWRTEEDEPASPLGPLIVEATSEGYKPGTTNSNDTESNAYFGYRFKLLSRQGAEAPEGAHDYLVDGKMIGGFGVLAYPEKYGASGVMTFTVSHDGIVFETDLGPETEAAARAMDAFNPGSDWKQVATE